MSIVWNFGPAAERARFNLKLKKNKKKQKAPSLKLQAASLTGPEGYYRIQTMNEKQLKRIADAIEEILRLVKKDMERMEKIK